MCGVRMTLRSPCKGGFEGIIVALGFHGKDVDSCAQEMPRPQPVCQGVEVHDLSPGGVDQYGLGLHAIDRRGVDQAFRGLRSRHVAADHVGLGEQRPHIVDLLCVPQLELAHHIVEAHAHAKGFRHHPQLSPDVAVANNAKGLPAKLEAVCCAFKPAALVGREALFRDSTEQKDGLGEHELSDGTGIGKGGVEDRNAKVQGGFQINLVGPDAKAANGHEAPRCLKHLSVELGARANADHVRLAHLFEQRISV